MGEVYQGLLKRVGASLENLKILGEKNRLEWRGQGRFIKDDEQGKPRSAFRNNKLDKLPQERTRSRRRRYCYASDIFEKRVPSKSGLRNKKGFKPNPKAALAHRS